MYAYLCFTLIEMNNSNKKKSNKRFKNNNNNGKLAINPNNTLRAFTPTIRCTKKFRFICQHSVQKLDLTDTDLMFLLGVAVNASTTTPIFGSTRFKKIEIWAVNNQPPLAASLGIEYKGNNPNYGNNSVVHTSSSLNTMQYSYVKSIPPKESYANAWLYPSSYNLLQITCPEGAVVDVTLEFTLIDDTPSFVDPVASAGLTPGDMYCHTLTAQTAPGVFAPVGWNASA